MSDKEPSKLTEDVVGRDRIEALEEEEMVEEEEEEEAEEMAEGAWVKSCDDKVGTEVLDPTMSGEEYGGLSSDVVMAGFVEMEARMSEEGTAVEDREEVPIVLVVVGSG